MSWRTLLGSLPFALIAVFHPFDCDRDRRPAARGSQDLPLEARVPRMADAEAQLAHARRLKRTMYAQSPDVRDFWRQLAVEAYRAVRAYHPQARTVGAEAAFRAAELLRAAGDGDAALREFRVAEEHGRGTDFAARAGLERGHIQRRRKALRASLDAYLRVASDASAPGRFRDRAWYWAGMVWRARGEIVHARRAWQQVAEEGQLPLDRVAAFDALALSWLEAEDPGAAAGVLNNCLQALSEVACEETEVGERVREALLRMRVVARLQEHVAASREARSGASNTRSE